MIYVVVLIIVFIVYFLIIYNYQINLLNKYERSKSVMEIYLQQRFDLIPNLVSLTKGYMKYEEAILQKLTLLREDYNKSKSLKTAEKIEQQYENIMLKIEDYPELKANTVFKDLSKTLVVIENQIQASRRAYNYDVMKYNLLIKTFPNNIFSNILKWREKQLFKADNGAEYKVKIEKICL